VWALHVALLFDFKNDVFVINPIFLRRLSRLPDPGNATMAYASSHTIEVLEKTLKLQIGFIHNSGVLFITLEHKVRHIKVGEHGSKDDEE
jgi:hypothetical protein